VSEPHRPTSELVGAAWLKGVPGLPAEQIGTTLPSDVEKWADGFVQILVVGGSDHPYVPIRRPVFRVSCWVPGGKKPRYGEANVLADAVIAGTRGEDGHGRVGRRVEIAVGDYAPALVLSAWPVSAPMRVEDPAGYARYDVSLELHWTVVTGF
jgi:hypothetical protein